MPLLNEYIGFLRLAFVPKFRPGGVLTAKVWVWMHCMQPTQKMPRPLGPYNHLFS
jgi:hypothetical protein